MILYVVTIEYVDGVETKLGIPLWEDAAKILSTLFGLEHNAKQVKRVTICPRHTP